MAFSMQAELTRLIARMGRGQVAHDSWEALFALLASEKKTVRCCFDETVIGTASAGDHQLTAEGGVATIPAGAIITGGYLVGEVDVAGASGTILLKAINDHGTPVSKTLTTALTGTDIDKGTAQALVLASSATAIRLNAASAHDYTIYATVATATLTAGKIWYYLDYVMGSPFDET